MLALHELTEKADCVLPVENQVRGIEGRGERGKREEKVGPGVEEVRRRGGREANSSKRSVEYEEKMKLEVKSVICITRHTKYSFSTRRYSLSQISSQLASS